MFLAASGTDASPSSESGLLCIHLLNLATMSDLLFHGLTQTSHILLFFWHADIKSPVEYTCS